MWPNSKTAKEKKKEKEMAGCSCPHAKSQQSVMFFTFTKHYAKNLASQSSH